MQLSNIPGKLVLPFANAGGKSVIPVASQVGITAGAASLTDGFPPLTRTPIAAGGVPPSGLDMNGILYEMSAIIRWANAGGGYPYDGTFATDTNVGGYPKGARIMRTDGTGYWFNTVENNVTDPESAGAAAAGWVPDFTTGVAPVTMTSANVTLTPVQYGKPIIVISGLLTGNLNLIFPAIVTEWTVVNNTTGGFIVTLKTATGVGIDSVTGTVEKIYCDGTSIGIVGISPTNLAKTTGASEVGADDGAGGTIFAKVSGFISKILSSAGSKIVGYLQAGTGAIFRSIESRLRETVSVLDFLTDAERADVLSCTGALDVGVNCDKARDYVLTLGRKGKLKFPTGVYSRSTTWDFSYPGLFVCGDGRFNTVLKYTGSSTAFKVDDSHPNNGAYAFTHYLADFCIEGTGATQILLYLKNLNHVNWSNINLREANSTTGVGFLINGSVCGFFSNIVCSTNAQLMTNRPATGLIVDRDPTTLGRATDNTFINCIIEGAPGDGVQLVNSDQSLFIGGTSENNGGNGVTIAAGSRMNTFISVGFENDLGFADIYDGGFSNRFVNCYSKKLIYIDTSSQFSKVEGGFHQSITAAGDFATLQDLKYSFFAAGGAITPSQTTSTRNLFNANTSQLTFAVKAPVPATVTASPYTYTNGSGLDQEVVVQGGVVSQIVFNRGGPVVNLPIAGMFRLAPNDELVISYSVVPVVVAIPHGTNYI